MISVVEGSLLRVIESFSLIEGACWEAGGWEAWWGWRGGAVCFSIFKWSFEDCSSK